MSGKCKWPQLGQNLPCSQPVSPNTDFCLSHKCAEFKCQSPVALYYYSGTSNPFETLKYCYRHGCLDRTCVNPIIPNFDHCEIHKCVEYGCNIKKAPNFRLCPAHKCRYGSGQYGSCPNRMKGILIYCSSHKCVDPGCSQPRPNGPDPSPACISHRCRYESCRKLVEGTLMYCSDHKCATPGCPQSHSKLSAVCSAHKCRYESCPRSIKGQLIYCPGHQCLKKDCPQPSSGSSFCSSHQCKVCSNERTENSGLCDSHKCQILTCGQPHSAASSFCTTHHCKICPKKRMDDSQLCKDHKCSIFTCGQEHTESSWFCFSHRCKVCDNERTKDSQLCERHKCWNRVCGQQKTETAGDFCRDHECDYGSCTNENRHALGKICCAKHECKKPSCSNTKLKGEDCCERCKAEKCHASICNQPRAVVQRSGKLSRWCSQEHKCAEATCDQPKRSGRAGYCENHPKVPEASAPALTSPKRPTPTTVVDPKSPTKGRHSTPAAKIPDWRYSDDGPQTSNPRRSQDLITWPTTIKGRPISETPREDLSPKKGTAQSLAPPYHPQYPPDPHHRSLPGRSTSNDAEDPLAVPERSDRPRTTSQRNYTQEPGTAVPTGSRPDQTGDASDIFSRTELGATPRIGSGWDRAPPVLGSNRPTGKPRRGERSDSAQSRMMHTGARGPDDESCRVPRQSYSDKFVGSAENGLEMSQDLAQYTQLRFDSGLMVDGF
jgi:hypothetical protein